MVGTEANPLPGSAAYVVEDAKKRAAQGLPPVATYLDFTDPLVALAAATAVVTQGKLSDLSVSAAAGAIKASNWRYMTDAEFKAAVRNIVRTSHSGQEIVNRLRDELGYDHPVDLHVQSPDGDYVDREAADLARALGVPVTASNLCVAMALNGPSGKVINL